MRNPLKVVIDTNIFVSALLGSKNSCHILDAFLDGKFDLVISEELLHELADVTTRPKFSGLILQKESESLLELLEDDAERVSSKEKLRICRDPKDNTILECAIAGKVDVVVSGDKDLLALHPFKGISIFSPFQFLKNLTQ